MTLQELLQDPKIIARAHALAKKRAPLANTAIEQVKEEDPNVDALSGLLLGIRMIQNVAYSLGVPATSYRAMLDELTQTNLRAAMLSVTEKNV